MYSIIINVVILCGIWIGSGIIPKSLHVEPYILKGSMVGCYENNSTINVITFEGKSQFWNGTITILNNGTQYVNYWMEKCEYNPTYLKTLCNGVIISIILFMGIAILLFLMIILMQHMDIHDNPRGKIIVTNVFSIIWYDILEYHDFR